MIWVFSHVDDYSSCTQKGKIGCHPWDSPKSIDESSVEWWIHKAEGWMDAWRDKSQTVFLHPQSFMVWISGGQKRVIQRNMLTYNRREYIFLFLPHQKPPLIDSSIHSYFLEFFFLRCLLSFFRRKRSWFSRCASLFLWRRIFCSFSSVISTFGFYCSPFSYFLLFWKWSRLIWWWCHHWSPGGRDRKGKYHPPSNTSLKMKRHQEIYDKSSLPSFQWYFGSTLT